MSDNSKWYYTDNTGAQVGPVSISELKTLISEGRVPSSGLAWTEGMSNWQSFSQIPELQNIAPSPPEVIKTTAPTAPAKNKNPYSSPKTNNRGYSEDIRYGGIGRLVYVALNILLGLAFCAVIVILVLQLDLENIENLEGNLNETHSFIILAAYGITLLLSLLLTAIRLKNTGCSMAWSLLSFIPIANIVIGLRCLCAQEGYSDASGLDIPGKITATVILLLFILGIIAPILFIGASIYKEGADRAQRERAEGNRNLQEQPATP